MQIKCYGGPLHGMLIHDPGGMRIEAADYRKIFTRYLYQDISVRPEPNFDRVSYEVSYWHEASGNVERRIRIAVIEGQNNLLAKEHYEIRRELSRVPWQPRRKVSFLKEFERWWSWCMYRRTGREFYLTQEFRDQ